MQNMNNKLIPNWCLGIESVIILKLWLNLRIYFWVYLNLNLSQNIHFIPLCHIRALKLCYSTYPVDVIRNGYMCCAWLSCLSEADTILVFESEGGYYQVLSLIRNHQELWNIIKHYLPCLSTQMYHWERIPYPESSAQPENLTIRK
jgi:hypothetical protein